MNSGLLLFRQHHNWKKKDLAKKLAISVAEYNDLESGIEKVDTETALKLSELYQAPPHYFLSNDPSIPPSVIYSHCHFENSNGYVNHLYSDEKLAAALEKEIDSLKEEIRRLRDQNNQLLQLFLGNK